MKLSGKISEATATVEGNFQHGDSVQFEVSSDEGVTTGSLMKSHTSFL